MSKTLILLMILTTIHTFATSAILDNCTSDKNWILIDPPENMGKTGILSKDISSGKLLLKYDFTEGGDYVAAIWYGRVPEIVNTLFMNVKSQEDVVVKYRITDISGRNFESQREFILRKGKNEKIFFPFRAKWSRVWGGNKKHANPIKPITGVSLLLKHKNDYSKSGNLELISLSGEYHEQAANNYIGKDIAYSDNLWKVDAKWDNDFGASLKLDVSYHGKIDKTLCPLVKISFPTHMRNKLTCFQVLNRNNHFNYIVPFDQDGGNPNNIYKITLTLEGSSGKVTMPVILSGKNSFKVNFGYPVESEKIKNSIVGTCVHFSNGGLGWPNFRCWKDYRRIIDMISAAGIKWIRDSSKIFRNKQGKFYVYEYDLKWLRYAKSKNIKTILIFNMLANDSIKETLQKADALLRDTKGLVDTYELSNEPYHFGGWMQKYSGGTWNGYKNGKVCKWVTEFLKVSNIVADFMKKKNKNINIIGIGVNTPSIFHSLKIGVSRNIRGIVEHPYTFSMPPEYSVIGHGTESRDGIRMGDEKFSFTGLMNSYKSLFRETGESRSVWITEFGFSSYFFDGTNESQLYLGVSEQAQTVYTVRAFLLYKTLDIIKAACCYDFLDDRFSRENDYEANFGMLRSDLSPKSSFFAVQRLNSLFNNYFYNKKIKILVEKSPLSRLQERPLGLWVSPARKPINDRRIFTYPFTCPDNPKEIMLAVWSAQPYCGELNNRVCTLRIINAKNFNQKPVGIDIITGESFDVPFRLDKDDIVISNLSLKNNPIVIKLLSE